MLARGQLTIMDFNEESNLELAVTENGGKRHKAQFSKVTKNWSSKPIKKQKDKSFLPKMVKEIVEYVFNKEHPKKLVILNFQKTLLQTKT